MSDPSGNPGNGTPPGNVGMSLADFRRDYTMAGLSEEDAHPDPRQQFLKWLMEADTAGVRLPRTCILATTGADGQPASRLMMLKELREDGFVFFTHEGSRKSRELAANPYAALNFPWLELERQVNVGGTIAPVDSQEIAAYFAIWPREQQLAAHACRQSQPVANHAVLEAQLRELTAAYANREIPLPADITAFVLRPDQIEFWQGRPNRLHDRLLYRKQADGRWTIERLSP